MSGSGEGKKKKSIHIKIMILISVMTKLCDGTKKMELKRKSAVGHFRKTWFPFGFNNSIISSAY